MKKIIRSTIFLLLFISVEACQGYKPIFSSSNFEFEIVKYSIQGDEKLGNQIYAKLYNVSRFNKNNPEAQSIQISLEVKKEQTATVKNNAGKVLEYRVILNTNVTVIDYLTNEDIINHKFSYYSPYIVQEQHSETVKLENKAIDNLINKTYENLLIKISESVSK